jgi:hypothetical protein
MLSQRKDSVHLANRFSEAQIPVNVQGRLTAASRNPGSRRENRRCAIHSSYSVCLSGRGRACVPAGRPLPASCGAEPVSRQRLIDFQPGQGVASAL